MRHSKLSITLVTLLSVTLLAGCNKAQENTQTEDTAQSTQEAPATQEATTNNSPTVKIMADGFVAITKAQLNANDKYTAADKECINKMDSSTATAEADKFLHDELTPEQLGTLDNFYASELGQKVMQYSDQQYKVMTGEPVENPITLTPEEQQQMVEFSQSPEGQKIQNIGENVDPQKYEAMLKNIANNELVRCGLEPIE